MSTPRRFPADIVDAIRGSQVLGVRASTGKHRIIGIWAVVVEGRVFVRSWSVKPDGWYETFRKEPQGTIAVEGRELPARAVQTRSERLKDAVDQAYHAKYKTKAALKYVRDLCEPKSRATTTELVPR
jgi:hypothetical protein